MNKKYTFEKQLGNKGAAYLESLLSDFSIVHRIDEAKDIGIDYICEYLIDENPMRLLFAIQCKTVNKKPSIGENSKTFGYWKGFDIPIFLFWLQPEDNTLKTSFECKFKRFTPILHKLSKHRKEGFIVFNEEDFRRSILIDYFRCNYRKGSFPYGVYENIFKDIAKEYSEELIKNGWAMSYALGLIYHSKGDRESLSLALKCFKFSKMFMQKENNLIDNINIKIDDIK